jgi:hypothetical protein
MLYACGSGNSTGKAHEVIINRVHGLATRPAVIGCAARYLLFGCGLGFEFMIL